ncbi:MAG: hypothetical protein RJA61_744 [Candidatus Parcubacteria bacterium]
MSEAPLAVTQTINRVVEKTIERVVPAETQANVSQSVIKETVVVKEEDVLVGLIEKNTPRIVRVTGVTVPETEEKFYGLGIIISKDGHIALPQEIISEGVLYTAHFSDGSSVSLSRVLLEQEGDVVIFGPSETRSFKVFDPVVFGDSTSFKLGQSTVVLGGEKTTTVSLGRVAEIVLSQGTSTEKTTSIERIVVQTDGGERQSTKGEILLSLSGDLLGFKNKTDFTPADHIQRAFEQTQKKP